MRYYDNKKQEGYKKFARLALFSLILNAPNFILTLITAIFANTAVVWVDTLVTLSETLHSAIVWVIALKICKETGDKYNFGMGRLEVFVSFICDLLVCLGMVGMVVGAVFNILKPEAPDSSLIWFVIMKVSCVFWDVILYVKQVKICRANKTKLNESEKNAYLTSLINDAAVGIISVICYVFIKYTFVQYFSPIASIVLAVVFICMFILHMKESIGEIVDISLPIKTQDEIYDIVMEKHSIIKRIISVNCRKLNNKAHIEVSLILHDSVTSIETQEYLKELRGKIQKIEEDAEVVLIIDTPPEETEETEEEIATTK